MSEDPRELARRLAAEAKQRHQSPAPEDPRELARRLAEQAKQRTAPPAIPEVTRPLSAQEALAKARADRAAQQAATPQPMPPEPEGRGWEGATVDSEPTMPIPGGGAAIAVSRLVQSLMPGATVVDQAEVGNPEVFRALWRAHLARAQQDRNLELVALANTLLNALNRLSSDEFRTVKIQLDHNHWAGWVDLRHDVLLGVAQPVAVYMPGS